MYNIKKNAFTLVELIIVIGVIWILMMATTVYLSWTDEKRKVIEAQWCASAIWWELNNFVFYALTSKTLKDNNIPVSPTHYIVQLTWCETTTSWTYCNKIDLSYDTWDVGPAQTNLYKTVSTSSACRQTKQPLLFYWAESSNSTWRKIKMNKWFSPISMNNRNVFYIDKGWPTQIALSWDIITATCFDDDCDGKKEIWKFWVDARSQTISRRNCKFYDEDLTTCKEREE